MSELIGVVFFLAALVGGLLALAPRLSELLVRSRARGLPPELSARMGEEWLAELAVLQGRASRLAFAIALVLTRRHSFAAEDESLSVASARSPLSAASLGGWPSIVVFTTVVVAAIAYAASFFIPPVYRSHARVLITPQSIPARFVAPADRVTLEERVGVFRSIVLSHRNLEEMILEFDLYKSDRGVRPGERDTDAAIARMRRDISIAVHTDGPSFEVAYAATDPRMVLMVTERLTSLFFKESARGPDDVQSALRLLDTEIAHVRSRLLQRTGIREGSIEHESLRVMYRDLLIKREQAILSADLAARQLGEQVRVVEAARLPEAPMSPDRAGLTLLGAVIGFCLGIAMMIAGRYGPSRRPRKVLART
jgi:hypothetical protein